MAYATKYLFKWESVGGTIREIRVLKDGYSGYPVQRNLGRAPILRKQQNGVVFGTSIEFYAECAIDGEFSEFYTTDPKAFRVDLYAGSTLLWQGYISPELYAEPDIAPPYDVRVIATDGIGELKLYDFAPQGAKTLRQMFTYLLGYTGLDTDVYLISSLQAGSSSAGTLLEKTINLDYKAGESCYDVLTYLLDTLHATITWWRGAWIVARETNVTFSSGKVDYYNTSGNSALLADSVQSLGSLGSAHVWPVGYLSRMVDPAKKSVTVKAPWHPVNAFVNGEMNSDTAWTKANNASFDTSKKAYYLPDNAVPNQNNPLAEISQPVSMGGLRVPMSFLGKFCATELPPFSGAVYGGVVGVDVIYVTGNDSYYLTKDDNGDPIWKQGTGGNYDFQIRLSQVNTDEAGAEVLTFEFPPLMLNNTYPAGTLTFHIVGRSALVFNASLDVVISKGYQDRLHLDNGARGEGNDVEVAIGRETSDIDYYKAFMQGILLDSGSLITSFKDDEITTGMDFLSFISRDYARSFALPRIVQTGIVFLESVVEFPPLVFAKGGLNYWIETWSWNMLEDELEISTRQLPTANITVDSEVISEAAGGTASSGSSQSSGGTSMSGGGESFWEKDGNGGVKLKDEYAGLWAKGFMASGGVGSSSGGSGIDLDRVWQSLTNNTDKPNVKINAAHIPIATAAVIGGVKVDGTTITIDANGVISAVGGSSGSVTSVALTVPTGLSVSGSPITSSGTLVIAFENGYSIPTTAKQSNWDSAYNNSHSHSNKSTLDGITSNDVSEWDTAYSASHTHSNKSTLDGISASDITNWNAAYGWGDHSGLYLPISGGTLTGDLRIKGSTNYGRKLNFGDGDYVYLYEDSDDHLQIYASKGLQITTGSSYYVQVDNEVVIGETSRQSAYKLYVNGAGYYNGALTVNSNISSTALITVGSGTSTEIARKICFGSTSYYLSLNTSNQFHFSHGVYSDSFMIAGGAASSSDRRLKGDIEDVGEDRALAVLMQLRPKEWTWNEKSACFAGMRGAGLVAQDVQEVLPFAVMDVGDYLSLNYSVLHAYEIGGLQNHEDRIAALEAENKELKKQLAAYATR